MSDKGGNSVHFFASETSKHIKLMHGTFTSQKFKPHFHECYTIIIVHKGVGDYFKGNKDLLLSEGYILVLNPYDVHAGQAVNNNPWDFLTIYVPISIIKNIGFQFKRNHVPFFEKKIIKNFNLFMKATQVFENLACKRDASTILNIFLKEVVANYATDIRPFYNRYSVCNDPVMNSVRTYIHNHFHKEIPITKLCEITQKSDYQLIKSFRSQYQLPPHQYQLNLRIEKARDIISTTNKNLSEVAYEVGFFDQSHFIRHFKKIVGVTPKVFSTPVFIGK